MNYIDYIDESTGIIIEDFRTDKRAKLDCILCTVEGLEIRIDIEHASEAEVESDQKKRLYSYLSKAVRDASGMNRVQFASWLGIPYRTMQEWEIGRRLMPNYLLRLIAYKVYSEKQAGNLPGPDDSNDSDGEQE